MGCRVGVLLFVFSLLACQGEPEGDLGTRGWPLDADGKEQYEAFADLFFVECWIKERRDDEDEDAERVRGVKGSFLYDEETFPNALFRWSCDELSRDLEELKRLIEARWGADSIRRFERSRPRPQGRPAAARPTYPADFDKGDPFHPLTVTRVPNDDEDEDRRGSIKFEVDSGRILFFDIEGEPTTDPERSDNYWLKFLREVYVDCCL